MSLVVSCQCGQSFAAPPQLAGQTLPCPACTRPITVPAQAAPQQLAPAPAGYGAPPAGFGGQAPAPYGAAPAGYGAAPDPFGAPQGAPGYAPAGYGAPQQGADPFAMQGFTQPGYAQPGMAPAGYAPAGFGQPAYGQPAFGAGNEAVGGMSTSVKAVIGVAAFAVLLLVCAIVGEQLFGKRQKNNVPVAVAPQPFPAAPAPVPNAPGPVPTPTPVPAPVPVPAPAPIPAPAANVPPGAQTYTAPGQFSMAVPPEYQWQLQKSMSVGAGVMSYNYVAMAGGVPGEGFMVALIIGGTASQKDRQDFVKGIVRGMTQVPGVTLLSSTGLDHPGKVPDRFDFSFVIDGNGRQVHSRGTITFGKKRASLTMVMGGNEAKRDSLAPYLQTFKEL